MVDHVSIIGAIITEMNMANKHSQVAVHFPKGVINMQGCTEAFFRMTCPDDDILQVYDIRFSEVEPGHPCTQQQPSEAIIPKELTEVVDVC